MAKPPHPADDDRPIADAASLFDDDAPGRPATSRPDRGSTGDEVFALEDVDPSPTPGAPPPVESPRVKKKAPPEGTRSRRSAEEDARVDQVWSRGAEWGPSLVVLAIAGVAYLAIVYFTFSVDRLGLSLLIMMVGAAAWVLLTYPIVVTMERPIRLTPEQAVKDYYAALSHHLPHYRRMWLLLSTAGRTSPSFSSFEGFKGYWKQRLAELRGDRVKGFTPLNFQVAEFKSEKSAGKQAIDVKYKVEVSERGKQADGPLATIKVEAWLVKGPDNQWYLNQGTLPSGRTA